MPRSWRRPCSHRGVGNHVKQGFAIPGSKGGPGVGCKWVLQLALNKSKRARVLCFGLALGVSEHEAVYLYLKMLDKMLDTYLNGDR